MAKTKISEWSSTPANNTDIDSINIAEGCAPSGINDAIRELMSQVKDLYSGTTGDTISVAGGGTGVGTLTGILKGNGTSAFTAVTAPSGTIVGTTDTQTLTNKTVQSRVVVITDATSITINADTTDVATQANTQSAGTLTINVPTGTPVNGQKLILRLRSTNAQTFSFNAAFTGSTDVALPTVSSGSSKYDYMGFMYNSTSATWQIIAKNFGF